MTLFALDQLIDRAAQSTPDHEAIRFQGSSLSYGELDAAANGIARALIDGGVRRGDRVALYLPKRSEAAAALYGIMRAGAAYVPIDPSAPKSRAALIAQDCSVSAVVTTAPRAIELLPKLGNDRPRLCLLVDANQTVHDVDVPVVTYEEATADKAVTKPGVPIIDTDLAYILYTSGSTGVPKGVMLTHRHALTFIEWCAAAIGTTAFDRFSSHAPLHFDLSVFDLYVAAHGGATVSIVPQEIAYFGLDLARFIEDERITVWYSVPSALMLLTRAATDPHPLRSLRAVVFAGEVYPTKHLRGLRALVPQAALWNLYGPTETNVCTYYRVDDLPDDDAPIPIGRACENTEVFAVRDDGSIAGVGEEGELFVRGSALMKGYWGRPERTARSLVRNPRVPNVPEPVYRTGDIVRQRADGNFDFLGRRDHQIKSRGYRIELGEIESALHAHPLVQDVAAIAVPHEEWGTAIVAYVVPADSKGLTEAALKRHAAASLPRYMIPARIEVVNDLPRTTTGKVDRQRLATADAMKR
jgi:amino acid adenylation domain-containing protein